MSFKTINLEEYKKLLKNKKKMFDMTFPTPETVNKYRDNDENINQKILHDEEINKQNKNLSEMFDKNLDKNLNTSWNRQALDFSEFICSCIIFYLHSDESTSRVTCFTCVKYLPKRKQLKLYLDTYSIHRYYTYSE